MTEKLIMDWVEEERARCLALVVALAPDGDEKSFLLHCIVYSVQPSEIDERRKRFNELSAPYDDVEDLM